MPKTKMSARPVLKPNCMHDQIMHSSRIPCNIGLKDKKLALIMCNYNNWYDTIGEQSNSKLCDNNWFIVGVRFSGTAFQIACGKKDFSATPKLFGDTIETEPWHGYSNGFLSKLSLNSNSDFKVTFIWALCGKRYINQKILRLCLKTLLSTN